MPDIRHAEQLSVETDGNGSFTASVPGSWDIAGVLATMNNTAAFAVRAVPQSGRRVLFTCFRREGGLVAPAANTRVIVMWAALG